MKRIEEFQGEYRFLSNFWQCPVEYEGIVYPSSENAFQAAKSLNMDARKVSGRRYCMTCQRQRQRKTNA